MNYQHEKFLIETFINPIINLCEIMNSILSDIRDFNLILSKNFAITVQYINIFSIIKNVQDMFAKQLVSRENKIQIETNPHQSIRKLYTDSQRLKQILVNLLSNAQKNT